MSHFSSNLKYLRDKNNISRSKLAEQIGVNQSTISRWENGDMGVTVDNAYDVSQALNVDLASLLGRDLRFDNAEYIEEENIVSIPVLGVIKAGIPIEAQEDIIEYVEIPKKWTLGGKQFYGLKISGDSMFPKYNDKDVVIFEKNEDMTLANNKDCAVMVNGDDATFKKVLLNESGIVLVPYNSGAYDMKMYSKEDIINKPIRIIGIAKEKRTKID